MMRQSVSAFNIETNSPSDTSGIERLINNNIIDPRRIIAIIGKTEGNGGRNDFSRSLSEEVILNFLSVKTGYSTSYLRERVILSFSGGTEGVVTPHIVVFSCEDDKKDQFTINQNIEKRLAIGIGYTRKFESNEIGRMAQIRETSSAIKSIVNQLNIPMEDIHLIQMKGAIPNSVYS